MARPSENEKKVADETQTAVEETPKPKKRGRPRKAKAAAGPRTYKWNPPHESQTLRCDGKEYAAGSEIKLTDEQAASVRNAHKRDSVLYEVGTVPVSEPEWTEMWENFRRAPKREKIRVAARLEPDHEGHIDEPTARRIALTAYSRDPRILHAALNG